MSRVSRKEQSRLVNPPPPNSIRFFRLRAGLAREEVGRKLGVSGETIRKLEQCDTWLDADRAVQISRVLRVPYGLLGFSYASDAYAWATKAVPVVGEVTANDEVKFVETDRRVAGGPHLPRNCVALDIKIGKMRGSYLIYQEDAQLAASKEVLARQGNRENFLVHLVNGTTWWRHIVPSPVTDLYHLHSQYLDTINDVRIAWISEILGFELARYPLPTTAQLEDENGSPSKPWAPINDGASQTTKRVSSRNSAGDAPRDKR